MTIYMITTQLPSFTKSTRQLLTPVDIAVLTVIFFGQAIYQSTQRFLALQQAGQAMPTDLGFSTAGNYWGIGFELVSLAVAGGYLWWRKFDFRQLNFRVNRYTLPLALLFGLTADMVAGGYDFLSSLFYPQVTTTEQAMTGLPTESGLTADVAVYALLNGFYEEVFFLGLLFCVPRRYYGWMMAYSLLVRLSFHTYQGLESAMVISSLGLVFLAYRWRWSVLVPFILAHAFFDMTGLGATSYRLLYALLMMLWY